MTDSDEDDEHVLLPVYQERPRTRGDCFRMPRPCPWVSCRYHLALDIDGKGNLKVNHAGVELEDMAETCALDAASKTSRTLEEVAVLLAVTRERVRQIEQGAFISLRRSMRAGVFGDDEEAVATLTRMLEARDEDDPCT